MKRILGLAAMLALGAGLFATPHVAHAQRGGDTVNCYSDNGRRSYCRVPWRDGIRSALAGLYPDRVKPA